MRSDSKSKSFNLGVTTIGTCLLLLAKVDGTCCLQADDSGVITRDDHQEIVPARVLDLSRWRLTLPEDTDLPGKPDEIRQPDLDSFAHPSFFFVGDDRKCVVFRAPVSGIATKGSSYPRSELREVTDDEEERASWGIDDHQFHTMSVKLAVTQTPEVKRHVVCAQIHDADNDLIMVRVEGEKLFIERNGAEDVSLERRYVLGTPFELKIQAGDGRIKAWYNGEQRMDWKRAGKGCYFKAGCYTQSNPSKGDADDAHGEVEIYALEVKHQDKTP